MTQPFDTRSEAFRLASRPVLVNLAKILLVAVPVVIFAYFLGRRGSIEYNLAYREPTVVGSAITAAEAARFAPGRPFYVPAYSHIYVEDGHGTLLTVTLSVRNVSRDSEIVIERVDYFDTKGDRGRAYLTQPLLLAPLQTAEFLVKAADTLGGAGANFMVDWRRRPGTNPPLVETIMVGRTGAGVISFSGAGVMVQGRRGRSTAVQPPAME